MKVFNIKEEDLQVIYERGEKKAIVHLLRYFEN